jgi:hypothetical protein
MTTPQATHLPPAPPRPKRPPTQLSHVKRGVGLLIRKLEFAIEVEGVTPKTANALVYAYSVLAGIIQGADMERRLETLEALAASMEKKP